MRLHGIEEISSATGKRAEKEMKIYSSWGEHSQAVESGGEIR
jgi:hypothetical protein